MKKTNILYSIILGGVILVLIATGFSRPEGVFSSKVKAFDNSSKTSDKLYKGTKDENNTSQEGEILERMDSPEFPGYFSVEGEVIYYMSPYDFKIYRVNRDGSGRRLISKDIVNYNGITIHGEWIYFINLSRGETLYRVSKDGTKVERVMEGRVPLDYECFFKYKGNLYYYDENNMLHSLNKEGEEVLLSDKLRNILANITLGSKVYDNHLYEGGIEGVYKISLFDGTRIKIINNPVYDFKIYNERIYYIDYNNHRLYSVDFYGDKREVIVKDEVMTEGPDYDSGRFYIQGSNIYYINYQEEGTGTLYRARLDGTKKEAIAQGAVDFLYDGKRLFYIDGYDKGEMFSIDTLKQEKKSMTSGDFTFCIDTESELVFFGVKSTEATEAFDGRLFFIGSDGKGETELK